MRHLTIPGRLIAPVPLPRATMLAVPYLVTGQSPLIGEANAIDPCIFVTLIAAVSLGTAVLTISRATALFCDGSGTGGVSLF
jgi:hypothetical protein